MQTPEQSRQAQGQTQKWKVVTSIATVAAFGFGGIAIASPDQPADEAPPAIVLDEKKPSAEVAFSPELQSQWEVVPSPSVSLSADDSLDSPLVELEQLMDDSRDLDDTVGDSVTADDTMDDSLDDSVDDSVGQDDTMDDSLDADDSVDDSVDQDDTMDDSLDEDDSPDDDDSPDEDDSPDDD